jgi:hypothetical protein
MTQDEIIAMATQVYGECNWHKSALLRLEAFVKLVAAKAFQNGYEKGVAAFNEAVLIEREACAKACEEHLDGLSMIGGAFVTCASAIRARGEATHPPQRTWVGLTVEEIAACCMESTTTQLSFYNAIEAKLKEKNT